MESTDRINSISIKPSGNNLVAFVMDKIDGKWYNCAEVENIRMEIRNERADLSV